MIGLVAFCDGAPEIVTLSIFDVESGHLNVLRTIVGRRIAPIRKEFVIGGSHSLHAWAYDLEVLLLVGALGNGRFVQVRPVQTELTDDVLPGLLSGEDLGDVDRNSISRRHLLGMGHLVHRDHNRRADLFQKA